MLKTKNNLADSGTSLFEGPEIAKDGLEEELDSFTRSAVSKIRFKLVIKPAIISFIALIVSFFLDVSTVPLLGDVTFDLARELFPTWEPPVNAFEPFSFWWLPIFAYALFLFISYLAYNKLKIEIIRTPASETIDRLIEASTSVIDSIATALPLIGAAVLLISITLGEEIFLGLSVPFEIKALIVLAIGKLFMPVLDQLGVEFQNVVNHVKDIRDKYFSRIQIESLKQMNKGGMAGTGGEKISVEDMQRFKAIMDETSQLSNVILKNFSSAREMMEKISQLEQIGSDKIQQLNALANSITQASSSLTDERTLAGLKHLEAIVVKK